MSHPDAFRDRPTLASALEGSLGAAEKIGHALFGDLVDVTGAFGFHGMVSTPPVAAVGGQASPSMIESSIDCLIGSWPPMYTWHIALS